MPEPVHLTITNGSFEIIYSRVGDSVTIDIPKGLYTIKATYIDYCQEYLLIVEEDGNYHFTYEFNYPSVAPALAFKTTHEYYSGPAEHCSHNATNPVKYAKDKETNFLLFASKYDKDIYPEMIASVSLSDYYITDGRTKHSNNDIQLRIQFSSENSKLNDEFGWFAHSCALDEGLYFLHIDEDEKKRIFPFYIFNGFQTQFFIRYTTKADMDNAFFYYAQTAFNMNDTKYVVLDKIVHTYIDFKNYELLTKQDKDIIAHDPYLVALLKILFILLDKQDEFKGSIPLLLPDLLLLTNEETKWNDTVPVLSAVMSKLTIYNGVSNFNPGSFIDRIIDNLYFDLLWNSFSQIEDPEDWKDSYGGLVEKSKKYVESKVDSAILKVSKYIRNTYTKANQGQKEERLGTLLGRFETLQGFNETVNSISNVATIADTLNVPPTKILRNYETYNKIYTGLKQSASKSKFLEQ
jgi:hypothetical protein